MGTEEIFLDHLPRIYHDNHHYQLVCTDYHRTSPCQQPSGLELKGKALSGEVISLNIQKHLLFATAEVNLEDPCY